MVPPLALDGRSDNNTRVETGSVLENSLVTVGTLVMHNMPANVNAPDTVLPPVFIVTCAEGASASTGHPTCCFQQGLIRHPWGLIDQDVQGLLEDPGLWELHLCTRECEVTPMPPTRGKRERGASVQI